MASVYRRIHRGRTVYRVVWREPGLGGKARRIGNPERHSVAGFLARWLEWLRVRGEHSPTTIQAYVHAVAAVAPLIGDIALDRLSTADLDRAYSHLLEHGRRARPLTPRSVLNVHRAVHTALEQARKWKYIPENPARDARAPSPDKSRVRAFTADEVERLLKAAADDPELYAIVATLLICGLRRGEVLGLTFDDVDLEAGTLEVRRTVVDAKSRAVVRDRAKTKSSSRKLRIPPELVALLRVRRVRVQEQMLQWGPEYQRHPLFVFSGPAGAPMTPMVLTRRLSALLRRAGIEGAQPCHGWRHTAATVLLDSGANIKVAARPRVAVDHAADLLPRD